MGVLAVPAVVALAAAIVLAVRPAARANQLLAALLAVQAAFMSASSWLPTAADAGEATVAARLMVWYALPVPLLTLAFASAAFGRPWRVALAAAGLATAAALVAFALSPGLFLDAVVARGARFAASSGPLLYVHAVAYVAASLALLAAAARAADDEARLPTARLHAATLGLAFTLLPLYSAGYFLSRSVAAPPLDPLLALRAGATVAGGVAAALLLPRLARPFRAPARRAALALLATLAALGVVDGLSSLAVNVLRLPGYEGSVALLRVAFAALTLLAALRYGLADAGQGLRRALERGVAAAGLLAAAALAAAAAVATLGTNPVGLGVGALAAVAAALLLARPLRAAAPRLLLPLHDPRAAAERARTYAAALVAARRGDGSLHPEGERLLARLRADLAVSPREHDLLLRALASRDAPADAAGRLGRYRLRRELGRGSAGATWLAEDEDGAAVVVKRYHSARDAGRVLAEARALAAVRHPRVVRLLEVDRRGDEAFLVLPYAGGGNARSLLDAHGPMEPARAVALARDVLDGLAALHGAGLVHRDVKLENVLLDEDGRALLADFGSARFVDADATTTGAAVEGTLATVAPEALRGFPPTPASDVYAVGAVLYRLLTAEHYVDLRASGFGARERVLLDAPRLPHPRVPSGLEPVLRCALAKDPRDRYAGAVEMRRALDAWRA